MVLSTHLLRYQKFSPVDELTWNIQENDLKSLRKTADCCKNLKKESNKGQCTTGPTPMTVQ